MNDPIVLLMKKYKKLTKDEIIGSLANWFNVVGQDEFDKAVKSKIIITSSNPKLWILKN